MVVRGQQISVSLQGGETVAGWLYAESRLGIYVALDRHGNVIRFIPAGAWQSASYAYDDVVTFDDAVDRTYGRRPSREASEMLVRAAEAALARTDFNAARRLYEGLSAQASRFQGWYERLDFEEPIGRDGQPLGDTAITVHILYSDLIQQLELSGLDRVLLEHSDELRELVGAYSLPLFDVVFAADYDTGRRFVLESMLASVRESNHIREQDLGRTPLRRLHYSQLARLDEDRKESSEVKEEQIGLMPRRLRKTAAVGKIAVGGALAAANITAGVFAGIAAALPTLGIGTVAGAVGIATSAYTGLNAACDGLKDLASAIERKA